MVMVTKVKAHNELVRMLLGLAFAILSVAFWFHGAAGPEIGPYLWIIALGLILFFATWIILPLMYQAVGHQWKIANDEFMKMMSQKDAEILKKDVEILRIQNSLMATRSIFLSQQTVDMKLLDLAISVERLFEVEIQLREDVDEAQLAEVASLIKKAKADFWFTHALAKELGFQVYDKIRDYTKS